MNIEKSHLIKTVIALLFTFIMFELPLVQVEATEPDIVSPTSEFQFAQITPEVGRTPLQQALQRAISQRERLGEPVPRSVAYDYDVDPRPDQQGLMTASTEDVVITAETIIQFDHPNQAGLEKWPDIVVTDDLPLRANGHVTPGDYTTIIRNYLSNTLPGIWDEYEFGYEPRRYKFKETYRIIYPNGPTPIIVNQGTTVEDIVFGFTETGPRIEYLIEEEWEECFLGVCVTVAEVKAGLELDWDIGLRLPVSVSVITPDSLVQGTDHTLSSAITPLDWSPVQYQQAGLESLDGNEFVLRYVIFLGVHAEIVEFEAVDWAIDAEYDASASFTTPFGPSATFPLPSLELSPSETGLEWDIIPSVLAVGIGLSIDPSLRQGEISADWLAVPPSNASGSGSIAYFAPQPPVSFGPVTAGDATDPAHIRLTKFRYGLDEFLIELDGILEFELFGFGIEATDFEIADFDIDDISDGPWLDVHTGTTENIDVMVEVVPDPGPEFDIFLYLPLVLK